MGNLLSGGPCGDRLKPLSVSFSDYFLSNSIPSSVPGPTQRGLVAVLKAEVIRLRSVNTRLASDMEKAVSLAAAENQSLVEEHQSLRNRLDALLDELAALQKTQPADETPEDSEAVVQMTKELQTMKERNDSLESELAKLKDIESELWAARQENRDTKSELTVALHRNEDLTLSLKTLEGEILKEQNLKTELDTKNNEGNAKAAVLEAQISVLEQRIKSLETDKENIDHENVCNKSNVQYLEAQRQKIQATLQAVQLENKDLKLSAHRLETDLIAVRKDREYLQTDRESLQAEREILLADLARLRRRKTDISSADSSRISSPFISSAIPPLRSRQDIWDNVFSRPGSPAITSP